MTADLRQELSKKKKVYIGNGETIYVKDNETVSFYLDIDKVKRIVTDNPEKEILVGATGDWFFTAQTITIPNLKEIEEYKKHILRSSCWSRFSIRWDDCEEDCTIEIPKHLDRLAFANGFDHGYSKVHFWIHNMYPRMQKFEYEKIKKFSEDVEELLKKYELQGVGVSGLI